LTSTGVPEGQSGGSAVNGKLQFLDPEAAAAQSPPKLLSRRSEHIANAVRGRLAAGQDGKDFRLKELKFAVHPLNRLIDPQGTPVEVNVLPSQSERLASA